VRVELEGHSARLVQLRGRSLAPAYRAALARSPEIRRALAGLDFRPALEGRRLSWTASSPLAAYVTIAFAAGHLRVNNWDKVTEGYKAYTAGRYGAALAAYRQALELNPADAATRCRAGAVHQKLGQLELARGHFAHGVEHLEEIGGNPMRTWCALGLAQVALALGDRPAARVAARRVLAMPDFRGRHGKAKEILRRCAE
jgi:tetratricopeptide (TPR) repeat protein